MPPHPTLTPGGVVLVPVKVLTLDVQIVLTLASAEQVLSPASAQGSLALFNCTAHSTQTDFASVTVQVHCLPSPNPDPHFTQ